MAGTRQPIDLLLIKGKKHLTKKEIEERKNKEVKAKSDKVRAPTYLPSDLKREFRKIANELLDIGIMTNLDVDALARFLLAKKMYLQVTNSLLAISPVEEVETETGVKVVPNDMYSNLLLSQDKLFKQCRQAASDLGLTISSRCRLVVPKKEEKHEKTDFERQFGDV